MTRATICATITLAAKAVYDRHAARRDGSSMISDAILFYEDHGPLSKHGMHQQLSKREARIAFFQEYILKMNAELALLKEIESDDID